MSSQSEFSHALIHAEMPLPQGLVAWNGSDPAQRFNVYRNNVAVSLVGALQAKFPVLRQLVGDEFFDAMAGLFVRAHPPQSVVLNRYGEGFADFIAAFPPAADAPYLPDMARLESARVESYHAADADPLPAERLAAIAPEKLADIRIDMHPSLRILRSHYAIASLWGAHHGIGALETIDPFEPEDVLVARPDADVLVTRLPPGIAVALIALAAGEILGAAMAQAMAGAGECQPAHLFQTLMTFGLITRIHDGE